VARPTTEVARGGRGVPGAPRGETGSTDAGGGARPRPPVETKARMAVEGVAARRCSQPTGNSARARRRGAGSGEGAEAAARRGLCRRSSSGAGRRSSSGAGGRAGAARARRRSDDGAGRDG